MSNVLTDDDVKPDNFLAEAETMDLSPIRDGNFLVAIGTGQPEAVKYLCSSLRGPYTFVEMVQEVGEMWVNHQHHAKVMLTSKDSTKPLEMLDKNTIDYIECHYTDIITEEMLGGAFDEKKYTCVAGTTGKVSSEKEVDPRTVVKPETKEEDASEQDSLP